jgi:hypothetical protein
LRRSFADAAQLPLKDAAFALWRRKPRLDALELPPRTPEEIAKARAAPMAEISARIQYQRDHAQDGPTFGRLKRAHPQATDADVKQAIVAAVKFDDDCFRYFRYGRNDYMEGVERAVALAAGDNPGYLAKTYRDAENHVAFYMK